MFDIFKSKQERLQAKVEKFVSLQNEFSGVNTRIDELAIEFATRDSEFKKALEQEKDEFIRGRIESKYQEFTKSHLKNIGTVKREKESLMKAMKKVYSDDPEFQEILAEEKLHKSYNTILSNYRSNKIDLNTCDTLLKAIQHKYIRKTPDGKGGWNYVYEEEKGKELKKEEIKRPNVRKIAQKQLVLSVKRKPLIGEKIKFIRFGDIVEKSKNWVSGELENGMSVYSLNKDGAAEQSIRSEFLNRKAIIGEGVVVGYGSDEEPIIQNIQNTKRATKKDVDKAEFYGLGKSKWLEYLDKMERNMIEIDGELHPVSNSTLKKSEATFPFMQPYLDTIGEALKTKKETGKDYNKLLDKLQERRDPEGIEKKRENKVKYADNIVFNNEGKVLLLKRSENDKTFAGMYVIPGGHVDLGEDCETAAKRELYEEAGIEVEDVQFVGEYEDKKVHIKYYQSHTDKDPVLQQEEIWGYEWVELKDLDNYPMPFNMCENIKKVLNPYNFKQQVVKIKKALEDDLINPSQYKALMRNVLEKAKKAHSGEIHTWGNDRMQKQPDGSWKKLFERKSEKEEGGNEFQKIKDYAERIIKGEKQIERLSPEEEQGRITGGRINVEATLQLGSSSKADEEFPNRGSQLENLEKLSKNNGYFVEDYEKEFGVENRFDKATEDNLITPKQYDLLLEKAWTKHPVGAVVTRKDGTRWKKISETGNSKADWKQITKDKGSKPEDVKEAKNSTKEEGQTQNPTNLTEAAKNASETALNAAIKGSGDEKMRQAAHEELDRRDKEERVQEEEKGNEKKNLNTGDFDDEFLGNYIKEQDEEKLKKIKDNSKNEKLVELAKKELESRFSNGKVEEKLNTKNEEGVDKEIDNLIKNRPKIKYDTVVYDENSPNKKKKQEGESDIIDLAGRKIVVLDVKGMNIPFYLSTGHGGKADVTSGKWYPIFGVAEDGWMNKLSGKEINDYYGSEELKKISEKLDSSIGDIRDDNSVPKAGISGKHIDFINKDLKPTNNGLSTTRDTINRNISSVKDHLDKSFKNNKSEQNNIKKSEDDQLNGGKADKLTLQQIADKHKVSLEVIKEQLQMGIKVEMEHTDDPKLAIEIAMDHLTESPEYYTKLAEMESSFDKEKEKDE